MVHSTPLRIVQHNGPNAKPWHVSFFKDDQPVTPDALIRISLYDEEKSNDERERRVIWGMSLPDIRARYRFEPAPHPTWYHFYIPQAAEPGPYRTIPSRPPPQASGDLLLSPRIQNEDATILRIPTELLSRVIRYLPRGDIANFRLACLHFGTVASRELFRTVAFHSSTGRLDKISNQNDLARWVRTLVWDSNLSLLQCIELDLGRWEDDPCRSFEQLAKLYCMYYEMDEVPYMDLEDIKQAGRRWYVNHRRLCLDKIRAGNHLLCPQILSKQLSRFSKLNKIYLVKGRFSIPFCDRVEHLGSRVPQPGPSVDDLRGVMKFAQSEREGGVGVQALFDLVEALRYYDIDTKNTASLKVRCKALDYKAFIPDHKYPRTIDLGIGRSVSCVRSLHLQITSVRYHANGFDHDLSNKVHSSSFNYHARLALFILKFTKLESLSLEFDRAQHQSFTSAWINRTVPNTKDHTLPIRKLKLVYMSATESVIPRLVDNLSGTLQSLRLHNIRLKIGPSPTRTDKNCLIRMFDQLRSIIPGSKLKDIQLSGWWMDESIIGDYLICRSFDFDVLGPQVVDYLLHGGINPLQASKIRPGRSVAFHRTGFHRGVSWTNKFDYEKYRLHEWYEPCSEEDFTEMTDLGDDPHGLYSDMW